MKSLIKKYVRAMMGHRTLYLALSGCHIFAAVQTGKPEVYVPMAALYFLLCIEES